MGNACAKSSPVEQPGGAEAAPSNGGAAAGEDGGATPVEGVLNRMRARADAVLVGVGAVLADEVMDVVVRPVVVSSETPLIMWRCFTNQPGLSAMRLRIWAKRTVSSSDEGLDSTSSPASARAPSPTPFVSATPRAASTAAACD